MFLARHHGITTDELLLRLDEAVEAGRVGIVFDREFAAHVAVGFFQRHGNHGADAEGFNAELGTGFHQPVEDIGLHLDGVVQFPAQFTDEVDAQRMRRCHADGDFLGGKPWEILVVETGAGQLLQDFAGLRTGQCQHAVFLGYGLEDDRTIRWGEAAQDVMIVVFQTASGDEVETARCPFIDGKFRLHAPILGQKVGQRDTATFLGNGVGEDRVQPCACAGAGDFHLGEGRHIQHADILVDVLHFVADMLEIVGAAERPFFYDAAIIQRRRVVVVGDDISTDAQLFRLQRVTVRHEPVGALPAIDGAKDAAEFLQAIIDRCGLERTGGGALFIRVMHGENVGVGLLVLGDEVAFGRVRAEAARIDAHEVERRLAIDNPFRQLPARATGSSDAEGVAFVQPEVLETRGRADDGVTIRRIGDGAVIDLLDANFAKGRNAGNGRFDMRHEAVEFFLE